VTRASLAAEDKWTNSSVRATVRYKLPTGGNVYATYSTGFKSGAFNPVAIVAVPQKAEPEKVDAFEIGAKVPIGPVEIRAAAFHYKYDNIQLQLNNNSRPLQGTSILFNAASAKIQGLEVEAGWRVTPDFTLQAGMAWMPKAEYTNFPAGVLFVVNANGLGTTARNPVDLSGTRMIRSPKFTANLMGAYRMDVAEGELNVSANYFYNSGFFWFPGAPIKEDSYGTLSAKIAWTDPSDRYTFSVWGQNLTDTSYFATTAANTGGFTGTPAEPREIGFGIDAKF
jgi:iron complex outermembrane receptor protein